MPDPNFMEDGMTERNAYITGLIYSDGCLSKQGNKAERITIATTDRDLAQQLHSIICPQRKLYVQKKRSLMHNDCFSVITTNPVVIKTMRALGLTRRKSLTMSFPQIPTENLRHFVRGYFDGDGCVYHNVVSGHYYVHISFTTGSFDFALMLQSLLNTSGIPAGMKSDSRHRSFYVMVYAQAAVKRLMELMYDGATIFLKYKRAAFVR